MSERLDAEGLQELARFADAWVRARVSGGPPPPEPAGIDPKLRAGLFVTLRVGGELRGCIGCIEGMESLTALAARMADEALADPRFPDRRIRAEELPRLRTEVTVLDPPERVSGPDDLEPGKDGVVVVYRGRRGVYLPQVAEETGWPPRTLVESCFRDKAGLPPGTWRLPGAEIYRLRGRKAWAGGEAPGAEATGKA